MAKRGDLRKVLRATRPSTARNQQSVLSEDDLRAALGYPPRSPGLGVSPVAPSFPNHPVANVAQPVEPSAQTFSPADVAVPQIAPGRAFHSPGTPPPANATNDMPSSLAQIVNRRAMRIREVENATRARIASVAVPQAPAVTKTTR